MRRFQCAIVLGLITTVLVTAWCVYGVSTRNQGSVYYGLWTSPDGTLLRVSLSRVPGKTIAHWGLPIPGQDVSEVPPGTTPPTWTSAGDAGVLAKLRVIPPAAPGSALSPVPSFKPGNTRVEMAYGWPLPAFHGGFYVIPTGTPAAQHDYGPTLPELWTQETNFLTCEPRTMPLEPMWAGVVVDSLVYGAGWWVVLFAPGAIRRWARRRRGACLACGYDRRGLAAGAACPECGAAAAGEASA